MNSFPLYRKSKNGKNYYCILNENVMQEVQCVGKNYYLFEINALQFPDIMRIKQLIDIDGLVCELSSKSEYDSVFNKIIIKE